MNEAGTRVKRINQKNTIFSQNEYLANELNKNI